MKSLFCIAAHGPTIIVVSGTKLTGDAAIRVAVDKAVTTIQEKLETIRELDSALNLCYFDDNADLRELETLLEDLQESDVDVVGILRAAGFRYEFEFRAPPPTDNVAVIGAYRYLIQEK